MRISDKERDQLETEINEYIAQKDQLSTKLDSMIVRRNGGRGDFESRRIRTRIVWLKQQIKEILTKLEATDDDGQDVESKETSKEGNRP